MKRERGVDGERKQHPIGYGGRQGHVYHFEDGSRVTIDRERELKTERFTQTTTNNSKQAECMGV